MKLYNCTVLLHGEILNQVPRSMVTAAEIRILRGLHVGNNDPVTNIVLVGETDRSDASERRRLANHYGQDAFSLDGEVSVSGTELVNKFFPPGVPLPQEVPPEAMEDEKKFRPDETETILLLDPTTGKMVPTPTESDLVSTAAGVTRAAQPMSAEDDPFAPERGSEAAAPQLDPAPRPRLGLGGARRTVAPGV